MILLTGASGFIGKHLLGELIKVYGENGVLAFTSHHIENAFCLLHNDYNFDTDFFKKSGHAENIHTIIHAGAFTPKNAQQANDVTDCNRNIITIDKLLKADLPNLKNIIYLSTLDVYGPAEIISEETLVQPASLYGSSKLYVEKMISAWANANNTNHQILRIGHVYGPGEDAYQKIIPITIKKILQNEPLQIWGTGKEVRSFIYIKDVVDAIMSALKLDVHVGLINIVSSQQITVTELVYKLIKLSGKNISPEVIPNKQGNNLIFDNKKMKDTLLSTEMLLDEGLALEWAYIKNLQT